jgi:hypothetical protein
LVESLEQELVASRPLVQETGKHDKITHAPYKQGVMRLGAP